MSIEQQFPADAIEVGRIMEAYGVKGGIKLQPFSASADGLLRVKTWFLKSSTGAIQAVTVENAKWHSDAITAQLAGYTDRDQAQALRATTVWVSRAALPKTQLDEYYWNDLIGCQALAIDGRLLGSIVSLLDTGVHSVLQVDCGATFEPALIPFVNQFVGAVDLVAKTVHTQWEYDWLEAIEIKPVYVKPPKKAKPADSASESV
jgi:16S rRNA processing protein RimM